MLVFAFQYLHSSLVLNDSLRLSLQLVDGGLGGRDTLSKSTDLVTRLLEQVSQLGDIIVLDSDLRSQLFVLSSQLSQLTRLRGVFLSQIIQVRSEVRNQS